MNKKFKILQNLYEDTQKDIHGCNFLNSLHKYHHINFENLPDNKNLIQIISIEQFLKNKQLRIYNKGLLKDKVIVYLKVSNLYDEKRKRKYLLSAFKNDHLLDSKFQPTDNTKNIVGVWGKDNISNLFNESEIKNIKRRTMLRVLADVVVILDLELCKELSSSIEKEQKRSLNKNGAWKFISNTEWKNKNYSKYGKILQERYTPENILNKYKSVMNNTLVEVMKRIDKIEISDLSNIHNIEEKNVYLKRNFNLNDSKESMLSVVEKELSDLVWNFGYKIRNVQGLLDFRKRISRIEKGIK